MVLLSVLASKLPKALPRHRRRLQYLLFTEGGVRPLNMTVPLDTEVGGGAMLRDVNKMGVISGGQFAFVPRPETLGHAAAGRVRAA